MAIGHEEEMVIELANEVRKVLDLLENGISRENKLLGAAPHIVLKSHIASLELQLLPEAIATDS